MWTLKHAHSDHAAIKPVKHFTPINYPKPDGVITFDLMTSVSRSNTQHTDQPCHLQLTDKDVPENVNLKKFGGPESRYCPGGVYEFVNNKLVINHENCLHCKAVRNWSTSVSD